jgi:hypothetical protein
LTGKVRRSGRDSAMRQRMTHRPAPSRQAKWPYSGKPHQKDCATRLIRKPALEFEQQGVLPGHAAGLYWGDQPHAKENPGQRDKRFFVSYGPIMLE